MSLGARLLIACVVALVMGFGLRAYDISRDAEWVVSPTQIAAAKAAGQDGVQTSPGTLAVLPIRSEIADALPLKWGIAGVAAGILVLVATRRRPQRL